MFRFLVEFFKDPVHLGAIAPSGAQLARLMIDAAQIGPKDVVIELGAGTGPMTQAILDARPEGPFVALEPNPVFAEMLNRRFPDTWIDRRPAQELRAILDELGADRVDRIVSSLPWAAWPEALQDEVFSSILDVLSPEGRMVTFTYVHAGVLPAAKRLRARLDARFTEVHTTRIAWMNLPPAHVLVCAGPRVTPPEG